METANSWPKVANPEFFEHKTRGAPGFVQRFYMARAAFLAHRVYSPVWDVGLTIEVKREMLMNGTYSDVKVVPLMVPADSPIADYTTDGEGARGGCAGEQVTRGYPNDLTQAPHKKPRVHR